MSLSVSVSVFSAPHERELYTPILYSQKFQKKTHFFTLKSLFWSPEAKNQTFKENVLLTFYPARTYKQTHYFFSYDPPFSRGNHQVTCKVAMSLYILQNYFQMKRQERVAVGRRRRSAPPLLTATRQHLFYTTGTNCIHKTKKMFFKYRFNQCKKYSEIQRSPRSITPDCSCLHLLYILYTTCSSRK